MNADLYIELLSDFPDLKGRIKELLQNDETFKEIAEDYSFCKQEFEKLTFSNSEKLMEKYSETLEALKEELIEHFERDD